MKDILLLNLKGNFAGTVGFGTGKFVGDTEICIGDTVKVEEGERYCAHENTVCLLRDTIGVMGSAYTPINNIDISEITASHKDLKEGMLTGTNKDFTVVMLKGFTPKPEIHAEYDDELLDAVLCTSMEGGSYDWARHIVVKHPSRSINRESKESKSEWAFDALQNGGSILFFEEYEDKEPPVLTKESLAIGVKKLIEFQYTNPEAMMFCGGSVYDEDGKLDPGMFDATISDAVIQFALFGEIVYG